MLIIYIFLVEIYRYTLILLYIAFDCQNIFINIVLNNQALRLHGVIYVERMRIFVEREYIGYYYS